MKKITLLSLAIFCLFASKAQTAKDTVQVQIAAVKSTGNTNNISNQGAQAVTFNGYIVLEKDKPNVYLDSRKTNLSGYRILYANSRKWEDN